MTIDITSERVLTLRDATKVLPRRRAGRKSHVSTLYRWALRGLGGVVLETVQIGGTTCTSTEALQRFFDELSRPRDRRSETTPTTVKVSKRIEQAEELLKAGGFTLSN